MKSVIALGLCLSLGTVGVFATANSGSAQLPFEACLRAADSLFIDGSAGELAAITACQGTTEPEDTAACIELADRLWVDGSVSELTGIGACQVRRQLPLVVGSGPLQFGIYDSCLRQAETSTHDYTLRELAAIRACNGLTQPAEVAPCIRLVESLWHDETEAELTGLSACQVSLY